jgi:hypothetical protein
MNQVRKYTTASSPSIAERCNKTMNQVRKYTTASSPSIAERCN